MLSFENPIPFILKFALALERFDKTDKEYWIDYLQELEDQLTETFSHDIQYVTDHQISNIRRLNDIRNFEPPMIGDFCEPTAIEMAYQMWRMLKIQHSVLRMELRKNRAGNYFANPEKFVELASQTFTVKNANHVQALLKREFESLNRYHGVSALSPVEQLILDYLEGCTMTQKELVSDIKKDRKTVAKAMKSLVESGWIEQVNGPRSAYRVIR